MANDLNLTESSNTKNPIPPPGYVWNYKAKDEFLAALTQPYIMRKINYVLQTSYSKTNANINKIKSNISKIIITAAATSLKKQEDKICKKTKSVV